MSLFIFSAFYDTGITLWKRQRRNQDETRLIVVGLGREKPKPIILRVHQQAMNSRSQSRTYVPRISPLGWFRHFLERQLLSKARSDSSLSPAINGPMLGTEFVAGVFPVSYEHNLVPIRSHYETVKSLSRCGCVIICGRTFGITRRSLRKLS